MLNPSPAAASNASIWGCSRATISGYAAERSLFSRGSSTMRNSSVVGSTHGSGGPSRRTSFQSPSMTPAPASGIPNTKGGRGSATSPSITFQRLMPSNVRLSSPVISGVYNAATGRPAASNTVGRISSTVIICSILSLLCRTPGHQAAAGTRIPPSSGNVLPLRKGSLFPAEECETALAGNSEEPPLSLIKTIRVLCAISSACSAFKTSPIPTSMLSTMAA